MYTIREKGDCEDCAAAGYTPPAYETNHIDKDEMIKYSTFQTFVSCTSPGHGTDHIETFLMSLSCDACGARKTKNEKR